MHTKTQRIVFLFIILVALLLISTGLTLGKDNPLDLLATQSPVDSTILGINADVSVDCQVDAPLNRSLAPAGNTTTAVDTAGYVGMYTSITIGADGLPVISYFDGTNYDLKVAHCNDAICSSATITAVDTAGYVGIYTSITIGIDGLPVISYCGDECFGLKVAHCNNDSCTSATISTVDRSMIKHTSITIGADGLPVISYYDETNKYLNGDLKVAHCNDVACTSATTTAVDTIGDVGLYTSITLGANGLPVISYYDNTNFDLKVAHCNDAACTSATTTAVDTVGSVGSFTSITIGADGLPVISYLDATNYDLKVAHCNDAACTSATTTAVDTVDRVGWFTSITIGADGLPVISYSYHYDGWVNFDLMVAHCNDAACTSATSTSPDTVDDVGLYTSITIGVDGLPVISYHDATNQDLKVTHCSNPFCGLYFVYLPYVNR